MKSAAWPLLLINTLLVLLPSMALAVELTPFETCLLTRVKLAPAGTDTALLRLQCIEAMGQAPMPVPAEPAGPTPAAAEPSLVYQRLRREQAVESLPSILTPHNRNYVLPITYMDDPNNTPYETAFGELAADAGLDHQEAKFQLSIKMRLASDLVAPNDTLYFGFTALSFWQAYNKSVSAPFRETNYEPEIFWAAPMPWQLPGIDGAILRLGLSHVSNGGAGTLSRSWNRVYADFIWEHGSFVFSIKPWWRIPESQKDYPLDAAGDDNPNLEHYLGHVEFGTAYRNGEHELSLMLRNNFESDHHGAVELEWTFPMWGRVRGLVQYFNGYGESLIDYDVQIERIGVGIIFSDLL